MECHVRVLFHMTQWCKNTFWAPLGRSTADSDPHFVESKILWFIRNNYLLQRNLRNPPKKRLKILCCITRQKEFIFFDGNLRLAQLPRTITGLNYGIILRIIFSWRRVQPGNSQRGGFAMVWIMRLRRLLGCSRRSSCSCSSVGS